MKHILLASLLAATAYAAQPPPAKPPTAEELAVLVAEGRTLAQRMVTSRPTAASSIHGVLTMRHGKNRTEDHLSIEVTPEADSWKTVYTVEGTNGTFKSKLTITHRVSLQPTISVELPAGVNRRGEFSSTDFATGDLALEFLLWPGQRLLKKEMRRSVSCHVLESSGGVDYSKVISWVDPKTLGIVIAEAYDTDGKLLKVFEPKKFTKVNGRWQIEQLDMRNVQTGSISSIHLNHTTP